MKNIKKIGMMLVAGVALATTSCSDFADFNEAYTETDMRAGNTLWQNISSDPELSDFAALVKKAGYSEIFNAPGAYTVWAPKNGTYDIEPLLSMDSVKLVKQFVQQHMANFIMPLNSTVDKSVMSLNEKKHQFTADAYDDVKIISGNNPSSNGVIHILGGRSTFYPNIYEYLDEVQGCDNFVKYIKKYETQELDTKNSVEGPMIAGKVTYLDSVMITGNTITERRMGAKLTSEDSTYTVFFPTDEAWEKNTAVIRPCFNYIDAVPYWDLEAVAGTDKATAAAFKPAANTTKTVSIKGEYYTDSLTNLLTVVDLAYSNKDVYNKPFETGNVESYDTLRTTSYDYLTNVQEILNSSKEVVKMSNGYVHLTDSIPYKSNEWYNPTLSYGSNSVVMRKGYISGSTFTVNNESVPYKELEDRDSLFREVPAWFMERIFNKDKSANFSYMCTQNLKTSGTAPELDIALTNMRSTKYHLYVVTVPEQITDTLANLKLYNLAFVMSYTDADGNIQKKTLSLNEKPAWADNSWSSAELKKHIPYKDGTSIATVPGIVNVIDLGTHEFPICYVGLDAYASLMICHTKAFSTSKNRNTYEQKIRVARVLLVPEDVDKEIK